MVKKPKAPAAVKTAAKKKAAPAKRSPAKNESADLELPGAHRCIRTKTKSG